MLKNVARLALLLGVTSCLLVVLAGPAYRAGVLGLELALLQGFKFAVYAGLGAIVLGLLAFIGGLVRRPGPLATGLLAMFVGAAGIATPLAMRAKASEVPMIHDITTDVSDPPSFVAVLPLRADASNPPEYDPAIAAQQQAAYPDVKTIRVREPVDQVFAAAESTAQELGWEVVAVAPEDGRIEATSTTRWFGFKDDIVLRIRAQGAATLVDARSKSRVGRSDLGKNAERLREFRHALLERLTSEG